MIQVTRILADIRSCLVEAGADSALITRAIAYVRDAADITGPIFAGRVCDGPATEHGPFFGLSAEVWPDGHAILRGSSRRKIDDDHYEWCNENVVLGVSPRV